MRIGEELLETEDRRSHPTKKKYFILVCRSMTGGDLVFLFITKFGLPALFNCKHTQNPRTFSKDFVAQAKQVMHASTMAF